ncbi:MAG: dTDP-4-dehydrorhamnose reductase [Saprospirales bacterium]|nr:dTDP-4-dehydrorhamnose reductase [Saprospirales bacterium]
MTTILITGAKGQLGRCFQQLAARFPAWRFLYVDLEDLDIADRPAVFSFFEKNRVHWCINCAAYAAVDKAENEPALARRVNVSGVRNLAEACARYQAPLIHFSTDYVYHSRQNTPFRETDTVHPKSVYARTKLAGDRAALKANPLAMVIRTSWLYAPHGHNFVRTMLHFGAERPALRVVYDQVGTPTYAPDLAGAVLEIVRQVEENSVPRNTIAGVWHYSNEGVCSWYDFTQAIFDIRGITCRVIPIESKDYPLPAPRPPFSVLNKAKIKTAFGLQIPHWRDSLLRCLEAL